MLRQSVAGILAFLIICLFGLVIPAAQASAGMAELTSTQMAEVYGGFWKQVAAAAGVVAFVAAVALTAGGAGLVLAAAVTTAASTAAGVGAVAGLGTMATAGISMMSAGVVFAGSAALLCDGNRHCP